MNPIFQQLGRKLRLGVIGGGPSSFIGSVHRIAARMSDYYELSAGVLSSNTERSISYGKSLGIVSERAYPSWEVMLEQEKKRADRIDLVAVMTPNNTHFLISKAFLEAGFHVICDKPITNTLENAETLTKVVNKEKSLFCVTYNYSAYPMVRQARAMVKAGMLGDIRQVHLTYVQGNLAVYDESEKDSWRSNPDIGGVSLVLGDIATHAFHLGEYVTNRQIVKVMADVGPTVPQRVADDYVSCLLEFDNHAKGTLWVTNSAAGAEHGLSFRIFGAKGGLEWHQERPNELRHRQHNGFEQIMTRRLDGLLHKEATQCSLLGQGHPEGYHDAFANLYREFALAILNQNNGQSIATPTFPTVEDGLRGVKFVYTCLKSKEKSTWIAL